MTWIIIISLLVSIWLTLPIILILLMLDKRRKYRTEVEIHRQVIDVFQSYEADSVIPMLLVLGLEMSEPVKELRPEAKLGEDLLLDESDLMDISFFLEALHEISITPEEIAECEDLGQLALALDEKREG